MSFSVLVVEDTELLRRMYADRLTQEGHRVLQAADGLEALAILRTDTPDLVLLDVIMPKMSGIELLEILKRDPRLMNIPVLILTNLGQDSDVQACMDLGAVDFLIKNDARPADVAAKIRSLLVSVEPSAPEEVSFRLIIRDHEADADRFVEHSRLVRRFWCPACEMELNIEMLPKADRPGWYDSHVLCPACGREY